MNIRKLISTVFALSALFGISYSTYNFNSAEDRVKLICSNIKPGMTLDELKIFSHQNGVGPEPYVESGITYIVEEKTFGRYGCKIKMKNKIVEESTYNFQD